MKQFKIKSKDGKYKGVAYNKLKKSTQNILKTWGYVQEIEVADTTKKVKLTKENNNNEKV